MKKIFTYIIILAIIYPIFHNITDAKERDESSSYSLESWYKLYQSRNKAICEEYKYINKDKADWKIKFVIKIPDNYLELNKTNNYFLADIKNTHRNNMNNIYKCAILSTQKKSLNLIKKDFNNSFNIKQDLDWKIEKKITQIDFSMKALKCNNIKDKNSIQKLNVLSQATYQTCKYINYLEYLKIYNTNVDNITSYSNKKTKRELNKKPSKNNNIKDIITKKKDEINKINLEIEHTYRVFPLAFQAYTEYENNITIHFLLNLIKVDYINLRKSLHKALNPINQVIYKISNAMQK